MRIQVISVIVFFCLWSCGQPGGSDRQEIANGDSAAADTVDAFSIRFGEMIRAMQVQDEKKVDSFISPQYGLLIIESEGAMPYFHIQSGSDASFRNCFEKVCGITAYDGELKKERLPVIDCDKENFYSKTGSFVQDTNKLASSEIWKYGNLSPEDQKFAEKAIMSVGKTVIVTSGHTYYFSFYRDQWYLTIIDARRPCNA
ncbi:MAG: hypothetical protein AB1458_11630 [Bacteroidota bacterium]